MCGLPNFGILLANEYQTDLPDGRKGSVEMRRLWYNGKVVSMDGAMTFRKSEPPQFIYEMKNSRKKYSGNLLEVTGQILDDMEILKEQE